jgi:hypothetical protein
MHFSSPNGAPDVVEIPLHVFDSPVPVTANSHIFVDHKVPWFEITDTLPRYADGRAYGFISVIFIARRRQLN